ncbi:MAG TPA: hypothetical protein VFE17_08870 [Candidatus Baltobacteraceae bacterium]|nr:hypothetical protein [Candidatus Baltobacteraceae bacterium]
MFILAVTLLTAPCNSHPQYALQPVISYGSVAHAGAVYRASAHLRFRLVEKTPALIPSVDPGLLDHVQGHYIIARRVAQSSTGTVQATGNTAAQARVRLRQAIERMTSDSQNELLREEHVYESVTENGAAQSQGPQYGFPGGPDARETCAQ